MTAAEVEEIKRHFDVVAERVEARVRVVGEAVSAVDAKIDREVGALRDELREGFDEVKAMIKFSYAELDRRVTSLESAFADLDNRVKRLEVR